MKKVALVLLLAVVAPSLALAWLAVRSLRDQEYLLQRQQSLLYQGVADNVSTEAQSLLNSYEREFVGLVGVMLAGHNPQEVTASFDDQLRQRWPMQPPYSFRAANHLSTSIAAAHPVPAAVTACRYTRSAQSPATNTPGTFVAVPCFGMK